MCLKDLFSKESSRVQYKPSKGRRSLQLLLPLLIPISRNFAAQQKYSTNKATHCGHLISNVWKFKNHWWAPEFLRNSLGIHADFLKQVLYHKLLAAVFLGQSPEKSMAVAMAKPEQPIPASYMPGA